MLVGRRVEPRDTLGRDEPGEDTVTLRPRRGEELLALGEPVGAEVGPHRAVVDGDDLRRLRLALRAKRGEALRRDAVDRDAVEDADRERADDGLGAYLLAGLEADAAAARRHGDRRRDRAVADALAELRAHAQGDLGRAFGDLEALPQVVRVEALVSDRRRLAQLGEKRRPLARAGRERERARLDRAQRRRQRVDRAQPARPGHAVEARRVGMRPRVVRIDGGDELAEQPLDTLVVGALLGRVEREAVLRATHAVRQVVGRRTGDGRVRRIERQPELLDEPEVGGVRRPDQLAAELHRASVVHRDLLDPPSDPVARLEHEHVGAAEHEIARGGEPGQPGADDHDVRHAGTVSSSARMRSASAGR